jgi:excisionase family DNA binding protein
MVAVNSEDKLLLTVEQAAAVLSLSRRTLWRLTKDGKLPAVRYGRAVRYWIEDLKKWVEQQREASNAETIQSKASAAGGGQ